MYPTLFFLCDFISLWTHLTDKIYLIYFVYTCFITALSMPRLAFLTPISLFPCKHYFKPFINIVKGEIMKKEKKNNQGIYFAETFWLGSLCGIGVYYNNKIHKLLQYYLRCEMHFLIIEAIFYTCLWNKWSSVPMLPMFSPQAYWKHSWVYNWVFH